MECIPCCQCKIHFIYLLPAINEKHWIKKIWILLSVINKKLKNIMNSCIKSELKYLLSTGLLLCMIFRSGNLSADSQHGFIIDITYMPLGYGKLLIPYAGTSAGSITTEPAENSSLFSAGKYSLLLGFFYNIFQADLSYAKSGFLNQNIEDNIPEKGIISGDSRFYLARAGARFSIPGDSSYSWIYAGIKRMDFGSSFNDTHNTGTGYIAGFEGLYSYGMSDVEFVIKCNIFAGTYRTAEYNSDIQYERIKKIYSFTGGTDFGIGIQYEPRNLFILFKIASEIDQISYRAVISGSDIEFACSSMGNYAGIEVIYMIPGIIYNSEK